MQRRPKFPRLEVLYSCLEGLPEVWHEVLSIDFEPSTGRIFVSASCDHSKCEDPLRGTGFPRIDMVKAFRYKE